MMAEIKGTSIKSRLAYLIASFVFAICCSNPIAMAKDTPELLRLDHGAALVSGSNREVKVITRVGHLVCHAGVTVYVFDNGKGVSIFDLDSVGKDDVRLKLANTVLRLKPAQQLLISDDTNAKFDDINPKLGIVHKKPQSITVGTGLVGFVTEFSLASAVRNISALHAMSKSSEAEKRDAVRRILKNAAILQPSAAMYLKHRAIPPGTAAYVPNRGKDDSTVTKVLQGKVEYLSKGMVRPIDMRLSSYRTQSLEEISGLHWLECKSGDWKRLDVKKAQPEYLPEIAGLITCSVDTAIKTELCDINCKQGVAALIVDHGDSVAVCSLDTPGVGDITVHFGNKFVRLAPGREIVLTKRVEEPIEHVSPIHLIGHRNTRELGTFEGVKAISTDFSLPSAMLAIEPLRKMACSKDGEQRRIARAIARNSVILSHLTIHDGLFHAPKQQ